MFNISKENRVFGSMAFLVSSVYCIFFVYIVMYLKNIGYSESFIGVLISATLIGNIIAQPIIGYLSDNFIGIKRILIFCLAITLVFSSMIPFVKNNYYILFFIFIILSSSCRPLASISDMYISNISKIRSGLDFGFVRSASSFGYALSAILCGRIMETFGFDYMFVLHAFVIVLAIAATSRAEDLPIYKKGNDDDKSLGFFEVMKQLFKSRIYMLTIVSVTIVFIGASAHENFLALSIHDLGGTSFNFGVATFISSASETPVIWNYYRLRRHFAISKLLCTALGFYVVRISIMLLFPSITTMFLAQFLQSISYGLFLPSFIEYLQSITHKSMASTAVQFGMAMYVGAAGVLGSLIGGVILENGGYKGFYTFCLICCSIGFIVFCANLFIDYIQTKKVPQ